MDAPSLLIREAYNDTGMTIETWRHSQQWPCLHNALQLKLLNLPQRKWRQVAVIQEIPSAKECVVEKGGTDKEFLIRD